MLVSRRSSRLTAATYSGSRAGASPSGSSAGSPASAIAAGPLIGGWVTTEFTWRYVFAGEIDRRDRDPADAPRIAQAPVPERRPRLDYVGVALSSLGLGSDRVRDPPGERRGGWSSRATRRRSAAPRSRRSASRRCRSSSSAASPCWRHSPPGSSAAPALGRDQLLDRTMLRIAAAARRPPTLLEPAAHPHRDVLRHPRVPPGRPRARRVRDRQAPVAAVGDDVRVRDARPAAARRGARRERSRRRAWWRSVIGALVMLGTIDVELNEAGFTIALASSGSAPACSRRSSAT